LTCRKTFKIDSDQSSQIRFSLDYISGLFERLRLHHETLQRSTFIRWQFLLFCMQELAGIGRVVVGFRRAEAHPVSSKIPASFPTPACGRRSSKDDFLSTEFAGAKAPLRWFARMVVVQFEVLGLATRSR